jgi:hypothetical protein
MLQVRYEAERAREQSQKQLAAAEGRAGVLHTRLDDMVADNRALKHKAWTAMAACSVQHVHLMVECTHILMAALHLYASICRTHTSPSAGQNCQT